MRFFSGKKLHSDCFTMKESHRKRSFVSKFRFYDEVVTFISQETKVDVHIL